MTLRIGIIGCGAIAESHLQALQEQRDCAVVACADVNRDAASHRSEQFEIPDTATDPDELLRREDIDVVAILTPPNWHAELALRAFELGKHVLIEKPLARSLLEADSLVGAARADRIAGVALMHRYQPVYEATAALIQSGALGKLHLVRLSHGRNMYIDSRFTSPDADPRSWLVNRHIAGGGMLMSSSIHFFSVVSYLLGDPSATRVVGRARPTHPSAFDGIEDETDLHIHWENGVECIYRESWANDTPYRAEIIGDAGLITIAGENTLNLSMQAQCRGRLPAPYDSLSPKQLISNEQLRQLKPSPGLFDGLWADLIDSIQRGSRLARLPGLIHARNMQAIVTAAYRTETTGNSVAVNWLPLPACCASLP